MFLVRVFEKKEEEGLFILYEWQCKIAHHIDIRCVTPRGVGPFYLMVGMVLKG
jgi:hypothetical protein